MSRTIDCFAKETYEVPSELTILDSPEVELNGVELGTFLYGEKWVDEGSSAFLDNFGCFRIMSQADGDKRVVWCRRVIAEIKAAKQMFMDLLSKGMIPYKVGIDGQASATVMDEFDPTAEEVIFMPVRAIAGG